MARGPRRVRGRYVTPPRCSAPIPQYIILMPPNLSPARKSCQRTRPREENAPNIDSGSTVGTSPGPAFNSNTGPVTILLVFTIRGHNQGVKFGKQANPTTAVRGDVHVRSLTKLAIIFEYIILSQAGPRPILHGGCGTV
ncbi:hypothetical protein EVAR_49978_1 [Eumeta japonica]|uniref:Uncharacterized protein n=1 Tax=Eumeta variegata TaxID=151549 RepID=A0A4C1YIH2_EUMVA|nr:hypothetical protein EVAR_49978_1 [Eumeta japonica]